jgi:hypothetical protein
MPVELTPNNSRQTAGFGFQVPVFRMNQGVNAATANPLSRGAMQQPMDMVSESQFGLDPNVMATAEDAVRQQFYAGIDELNQFVNKAAQLGIDPSKVDMTSPESFALNQEFRKMTQSLQQKARDIQSGAAQKVYAQNQQAEQRRIQDQKMQEDLYNMQIGGLKEQQEDRKRKKLEANIRADLGGDIFEKQRDYILSQSNQGIDRGDNAGLNELKTVTRTQLEKAKKVSQKYIDDPDALQYISPLIEFYEGVLSGERIILNTKQPTGTTTPLTIPTGDVMLSTPTKIEGPLNPVVGVDGKQLIGKPTIDKIKTYPYYLKDGKKVPILTAEDAVGKKVVGRAPVGVGWVENKATATVGQRDTIGQVLETEAYVVLDEDRARQLLLNKGVDVAPTKRQVQKGTATNKLVKRYSGKIK